MRSVTQLCIAVRDPGSFCSWSFCLGCLTVHGLSREWVSAPSSLCSPLFADWGARSSVFSFFLFFSVVFGTLPQRHHPVYPPVVSVPSLASAAASQLLRLKSLRASVGCRGRDLLLGSTPQESALSAVFTHSLVCTGMGPTAHVSVVTMCGGLWYWL